MISYFLYFPPRENEPRSVRGRSTSDGLLNGKLSPECKNEGPATLPYFCCYRKFFSFTSRCYRCTSTPYKCTNRLTVDCRLSPMRLKRHPLNGSRPFILRQIRHKCSFSTGPAVAGATTWISPRKKNTSNVTTIVDTWVCTETWGTQSFWAGEWPDIKPIKLSPIKQTLNFLFILLNNPNKIRKNTRTPVHPIRIVLT